MPMSGSTFRFEQQRLSDRQDQLFVQMEAPNINTILAVELLETVFSNLPHSDLKSALLVCRRWRGVGEYHKLWSWVTLKVTLDNLITMSQALVTARLKSMTQLHLSAVSQDLLEVIDNHPGLKVLRVVCDVSTAEPSLLAKIICKMEKVYVNDTQLTSQQCQEIFDTANNNTKLKELSMSGNDLSVVDAENMARVVTNLKAVDLGDSQMTSLQCQTFFEFATQETSLTFLNMSGNDLSAVNSENLSSVVAKLEVIVLDHTNLSSQQCKDIFKMAATAHKLKVLSLEECDLSSVNPRDLALVVSKLKWVNLNSTSLTPVQCAEIFKTIANASSKLEELFIHNNDLSSVNAEILAKSVSKLRYVDLDGSKLTTQQSNEIFEHLLRDSRLELMNISYNDLSEINPELMAQVMSKLEVVELEETEMESEQCKAIFEKMSSDCQLKQLNMVFNKLDEANPEDLARIIPKVEQVDLTDTLLATHQSEAIFMSITSESKITILKMSKNDLSSVNPELLVRAIGELDEAYLNFTDPEDEEEEEDLVYTGLTAEQCNVIFQSLAQDSKQLKKLDMTGNNLELVETDSIARVSAKLELIR